jgi:hypothetical protein
MTAPLTVDADHSSFKLIATQLIPSFPAQDCATQQLDILNRFLLNA